MSDAKALVCTVVLITVVTALKMTGNITTGEQLIASFLALLWQNTVTTTE